MYDLDFTPEDLAANQKRELTDSQRERIDSLLVSGQWAKQRMMLIWLTLLAVGLIVIGAVIEFNNTRQRVQYLRDPLGWVTLMMGGIVMLAVVLTAVTNWINDYGLRLGAIQRIEGKVWAGKRPMQTYRGPIVFNYVVEVRGERRKTFTFSDASALDMFVNGQSYRFYYIAYYPLPVVLSAEAIPPAGTLFAGDGRKSKE